MMRQAVSAASERSLVPAYFAGFLGTFRFRQSPIEFQRSGLPALIAREIGRRHRPIVAKLADMLSPHFAQMKWK
jgi:hypothetical protein